jgi:hypothetical protein
MEGSNILLSVFYKNEVGGSWRQMVKNHLKKNVLESRRLLSGGGGVMRGE